MFDELLDDDDDGLGVNNFLNCLIDISAKSESVGASSFGKTTNDRKLDGPGSLVRVVGGSLFNGGKSRYGLMSFTSS